MADSEYNGVAGIWEKVDLSEVRKGDTMRITGEWTTDGTEEPIRLNADDLVEVFRPQFTLPTRSGSMVIPPAGSGCYGWVLGARGWVGPYGPETIDLVAMWAQKPDWMVYDAAH